MWERIGNNTNSQTDKDTHRKRTRLLPLHNPHRNQSQTKSTLLHENRQRRQNRLRTRRQTRHRRRHKRSLTMKPNLSEYRNTWSHWEKNVFVERLVRQLQQLKQRYLNHEYQFDNYTQDMIAEFINQEVLGVEPHGK